MDPKVNIQCALIYKIIFSTIKKLSTDNKLPEGMHKVWALYWGKNII